MKLSAAPNRAEVVRLTGNNHRLSDLLATELHFAHRIDCDLFGGVHFTIITAGANLDSENRSETQLARPYRSNIYRKFAG